MSRILVPTLQETLRYGLNRRVGLGMGLGLRRRGPSGGGGGPLPLSVMMTAPANGATLTEDVAVTLQCAISRFGAACEFFVNGVSIGTGVVVGLTGTLSWTPADPGPYTIFARATEGADTADSPGISVNVPSPLTIVTSVPFQFWIRADLGITLASGVSIWNDQSSGGTSFTQGSASAQPQSETTGGPNGRACVTADGVDDVLVANWTPAGPAVVKPYFWAILRLNPGAVNGETLTASTSSTRYSISWTTTGPAMRLNLGATIVASPGAPTVGGAWGRLEAFCQNDTVGASDFIKWAGTPAVAGVSGGNPGSAPFQLFAGFGAYSLAEFLITRGLPTPAERAELDAYCTGRYGPGLA